MQAFISFVFSFRTFISIILVVLGRLSLISPMLTVSKYSMIKTQTKIQKYRIFQRQWQYTFCLSQIFNDTEHRHENGENLCGIKKQQNV